METPGGGGTPGVWKKLALIGVGVGIGVVGTYCCFTLRNIWLNFRARALLGKNAFPPKPDLFLTICLPDSGWNAAVRNDFYFAISEYQEALPLIQHVYDIFPNSYAAFDCYANLAACYLETYQYARCRGMLDM